MTNEEAMRDFEKYKALFHKIVPLEDCVSRAEVYDIITRMFTSTEMTNEEYKNAMQLVKELPSVIPARPHGHNNNNDYADCDQFVCSECGIELQDWHSVERDIDDGDITYHEYTFKYCPNCGAKMEVDADDE